MEVDKNWELAKKQLVFGENVTCTIQQHHPFGLLVSLDKFSLDGVIERIGMEKSGFHTPQDYPPVGSQITAKVLGFRDYSKQVELQLIKK